MTGKNKKRIILSDEDEVMDSAPNLTPSSKLAATLSGLNMTSGRKISVKSTRKAPNADENGSLASDNELDPELTRKVMEGGVSDSESEDDRYFQIINQANSRKDNVDSSRRSSRSSSVKAKQKLKDYYLDNDEGFGATAGEHHDSDVIVLLSDSGSEGSVIQSRKGGRGDKTPASSSSRSRVRNSSPPSSSSRTTPNTSFSALNSSRTSERCKAVSSRQNAKRDAALEDLRRKSQSGLSGVLHSSSEDEGEEEDADSDEVQYVGTNSSSAPRKASRQSSSSAASLTSWARSQAAARSAVLRKDEREYDEEDAAGDSVDDFIVGSDEEREEEEQRLEEARQRKEERRKQRVASQPSSSSSSAPQQRGDTPYRPSGNENRSRKRAMEEDSEVGSGRKSRRIVAGDDDEDEDLQIVNRRSSRKHNNSRPHLRVDEEDEEEGEEDGDADDESEEDDDDEEEEEEVDDHMMYLRMNAMRDEHEEDDMMGAVMPMRRSFPRPEALRLYIEMLALSLVDPSITQQMALAGQSGGGGKGGAQLTDFLSATRQVENLICTNRESLLGSSAWRPEFLGQLCSRPFYSVNHVGAHSCGEKCEACGRTSQRPDFQVYLFGTTYDARKVWTMGRWDSLLPELMFLHNDSTGSAADEHNAALARDPFNMHSSDHKNNKQFAQFSRLQEGSGGKSRSAVAALTHSLGEDVARSILSNQQRKRRVIELSDDDDDDDEEEKGGVKHVEIDLGAKKKQRREDEVVNLLQSGEEEEEEQCGDSANKWWLKKWPHSLTKEAESKWQLAQHCKNRTQLYHTLLHYKFRLLLKIRDRLESDRKKYRGVDLSALARDLAADQRFVGVEVARFENLLRHAGKKWGGKEEMAHNDIWSDDDKGSIRQLQLHGKGTIAKRTTASLDGWLGSVKS